MKRTGRVDGYLVEIRHAGDEWWVSPDQIMRGRSPSEAIVMQPV